MNKLEQVIRERPNFHRSETEIDRVFGPEESFLPHAAAVELATPGLTCYGIESDVLGFIADNVGQESRTLETGAGCSTLIFALCGCRHIAITPSESEIRLVSEYAAEREISLSNVQFVQEPSERYLPRCGANGFDLILLDGKHAFPWPILDWFFTADRLQRGGLMIVDDVHLRSVAVLCDFMRIDSRWKLIRDFSHKTLAFKKIRDGIHDVAWHMQEFTVANCEREALRASFFRRVVRRIKRIRPKWA